ncbi:MAG: cell division protein [Fimbriimonadales bacterium]|nr:MAG: cell division protein [Fimbriimonadales bacterium]
MLDRLEFVLAEALEAIRRNGWMAFAAINTTAIALLVFGGLAYAYVGIQNRLAELGTQFTLIVSIKDGVGMDGIHEMAQYARKLPGVKRVVHLPKEEHWKKVLQKYPDISRGAKNPFPEQLLIEIASMEQVDAVRAAMERHPLYWPEKGIQDANRERFLLRKLTDFVHFAGALLVLFTFLTAGTLIYNTVHLAVMARRQEIHTMRLVGASHATIRWPFLLEGGIEGMLGGILAGFALWGITAWLSRLVATYSLLQIGGGSPGWTGVWSLAALGAALGMLAAGLSVRKYLGAIR